MRHLFMALVLCGACLVPAASRADIIQENFDGLTPGLNATNIGVFSVTGGSVDVVGSGVFGFLCVGPESGNCVDMDGSTYAAGTISLTNPVTLTPGTYTLSFDLIGSQRGVTTSTTVTLGSLYNQTFVLASGDDTDGIVSTVITVSTPTTVNLTFSSNTSGNDGALLDNVDLKANPASSDPPDPAAEPTSLSLLTMGLVGVLGRRRIVKS
jgi:hypothetical protein